MTKEYKSLEKFHIKDKGNVFVVLNDLECDSFNNLIGSIVNIDGNKYKIKSVEMFMYSPPWRKGEKIGLLVY